MPNKSKNSQDLKKIKKTEAAEKTFTHPDVQLVKKIASISERAERIRTPIIPYITKFYKV